MTNFFFVERKVLLAAVSEVLPFFAGGKWHLVDAACVVEVVAAPSTLQPVPRMPASVVGLMAWRGRGICVVDVAGETVRHRVIVVRRDDVVLALAAETVHEMREADHAQLDLDRLVTELAA